MLRRDIDAGVVFAALTVQGSEVLFQARDGSGLPVWTLTSVPKDDVLWLKLERSGDTVRGYVSGAATPTASDWTLVRGRNLLLGSQVRAGLFVAARDAPMAEVIFDSVRLAGANGITRTSALNKEPTQAQSAVFLPLVVR
jgi:hypothetical protein